MKLFNDPRFKDLLDDIESPDTVTSAVHAVLEILDAEAFDDEVDCDVLLKHRRRVVLDTVAILKTIAANGQYSDILEHPILPVYRVAIDGVTQAEEFVDRRDAVVFGYDKVQKIIRERKQMAQTSANAFGQAADVRQTPTFEVIEP